jgi:secreted trypsin-like serine protease
MLKISLFLLIFVNVQSSTVNFSCGRKNIPLGLIAGGSYTDRGQWPWMCAVYEKESQKYRCSGNLITQSLVLTVAHCIQPKYVPDRLNPSDLEVLLGKQDLTKDESGSERRNVINIIVHEDWNHTDTRYDADIAILVLNRGVFFTQYITPVCLPTAGADASIQSGGTIVSRL